MNKHAELCLGTVQFGMPYGVTNKKGQVNEVEVRRILRLAAESGIRLLDTAQAYGMAETVLGKCWPTASPRRLISKLTMGADPQDWERSLMTSLRRLRASKLDGFLLHRSSDLHPRNGKALLKWLEGLRERGIVERIGVSIYKGSELEELPLSRIQIVQLPVSVYDQRLIHDGTINRLRELGIAIHLRSVFLQGLLLQTPEKWPPHISAPFREHHTQWLERLQQKGMCPLTGCLNFVHSLEGIEAILFGVVSCRELDQVLRAWEKVRAW